MKILENMNHKAERLKKELTSLYYAYQNPETGLLPKIIIILALSYALSPVDLIPDFIPVLGYIDDLIILPLLISLSIKLIPENIMNDSRKRAENEPVRLKKNLISAAVIIFLWIFVLFSVIKYITGFFRN